jgi:hypothetical protein
MLRNLMTQQDKDREDEWRKAKWFYLVEYVYSLSPKDYEKWQERQSPRMINAMQKAIGAKNAAS